MAQRRFHYEQAFEHYLRTHGIPYVAVDEARRALSGMGKGMPSTQLKNFDFVVYSSHGRNLLVDVKGRKHSGRSSRHLDNWVTDEDMTSMRTWEKLFGSDFEASFVFLYWCAQQPPDALFMELFEFADRWYALLAIRFEDYERHARVRSRGWGTQSIPAQEFQQLSRPLREFL